MARATIQLYMFHIIFFKVFSFQNTCSSRNKIKWSKIILNQTKNVDVFIIKTQKLGQVTVSKLICYTSTYHNLLRFYTKYQFVHKDNNE